MEINVEVKRYFCKAGVNGIQVRNSILNQIVISVLNSNKLMILFYKMLQIVYYVYRNDKNVI